MRNKIAWVGGCLFKWRWTCGMFLLILCVACELHGSSIGIYSRWLGTPDNVILGLNRLIRSDEWMVFTPFAFSQYYNDFQYFSSIVRGYPTDMFIIYGQAVMDWPVIFRPMQWGYLFLSPGMGLSFFWMGRLILLFLVSFEFGLFFLERHKLLSLVYAVSITFAPLVQWWFSVNSVAEILIFGQACVLLFDMYLRSQCLKRRVLLAMLLAWCFGVYALSVYPAWQVSCGYLFLACAVWTFWRQRGKGIWHKWDSMIFLVAGGLLAVALGAVAMKSWDAISLTKASLYPGARLVAGVGLGWHFFEALPGIVNYMAGLFLPLVDLPSVIGNEIGSGWLARTHFLSGALCANNSEAARIFDLAPLGLFLTCLTSFRKRALDALQAMLLAVAALFLLWMIISCPTWLAKATLLNNVTARLILPLGIIHLMLLLRILALEDQPALSLKKSLLVSAMGAGCTWLCLYLATPYLCDKYPVWTLAAAAVIFCLWLLSLRRCLMPFAFILIVTVLYSGLMVNPLARGTASVYESGLVQKIESIAKADKGLWLVTDNADMLKDLPIMAGAPTINSVNTYPVLKRWTELDPLGENFDVYNRYAHIHVDLTQGETRFSMADMSSLHRSLDQCGLSSLKVLFGVDSFNVEMNPEDLSRLSVRFILSGSDLSNLNNETTRLELVHSEGGYYIYKVSQ